MSEWKEVIEDGQVFYISEKFGNVQKLGDKVFLSFIPKVVKLGPFETLEQAKKAAELNQNTLNQLLDEFNHSLVDLTKKL